MNAIRDRLSKQRRTQIASLARQITWPVARASAGFRMLPDFFIVGAQRAGTTSLYRYLVQHPDVGSVRLGKGVHYFDNHATNSIGWYRAHFPLDAERIPMKSRPLTVGEGSPYYMFHPAVPQRIAAALPGARVIAILRDPIERAHSQWVHESARGYESLEFDAALRAEAGRLEGEEARLLRDPSYNSHAHQHQSYVARGQYAGQIERLWTLFGRDHVLVLSATSLFGDPHGTYARTLEFLGLPPHRAKYEVHNARSYAPIDEGTAAWLGAQFAESNERLVDMLGPEFEFRRDD